MVKSDVRNKQKYEQIMIKATENYTMDGEEYRRSRWEYRYALGKKKGTNYSLFSSIIHIF